MFHLKIRADLAQFTSWEVATMLLDTIYAPFVKERPICVMARAVLERLLAGVSKVLSYYPGYEDERQRNSNTRKCFHGSASSALPLLSRQRVDVSRGATRR